MHGPMNVKFSSCCLCIPRVITSTRYQAWASDLKSFADSNGALIDFV